MSGAVINGVTHAPPGGVTVKNWLDDSKLLSVHTRPRKRPVAQFILHRGAETTSNDPMRTKRILDNSKPNPLSSLFTLTPDGVLYQHWDPFALKGAHALHHNESDSLDVQGPLGKKLAPSSGQTLLDMRVAIGRKDDAASKAKGTEAQRTAILARKLVPLAQWSLTPAQTTTIRTFLPWWCQLRGIPVRACSALRTFRVGGLGLNDPATNVTGILAHAQVSGPGERVDGLVELTALAGAPGIEWRDGPAFWE